MPGGQAIGAQAPQDPGGRYAHDPIEGNARGPRSGDAHRFNIDLRDDDAPTKTEGLVHGTASRLGHLVDAVGKLTAELGATLDRVFGPVPEPADNEVGRPPAPECGAHRAGQQLDRFERVLGQLERQVRRAGQL